jgi:hypothetical protein
VSPRGTVQIPLDALREIGQKTGSAADVATEYAVGVATVYRARQFVAREKSGWTYCGKDRMWKER